MAIPAFAQSFNYPNSVNPRSPTTPLMVDLAKTPADRAAVRDGVRAQAEYGRPYFLPPGVPADRVAALRRAFDATMHDAGFVADAAKIGLAPDPMTGEQVQALIGEPAKIPGATVARVRAALNEP